MYILTQLLIIRRNTDATNTKYVKWHSDAPLPKNRTTAADSRPALNITGHPVSAIPGKSRATRLTDSPYRQ